MAEAARTTNEVEAFLRELYGRPVERLEPLSGGFWSSAYGYRLGADELVIRFSEGREGFEADRAAMACSSPELPVPRLLAIGEAFGGAYAISVRHHGRFLEEVRPDEAGAAGPTLARLLRALRAAPPDEARPAGSWRGWLLEQLSDDPARPVSGWRGRLAEDEGLDRLYRACEARVRELLERCPERRDLVHGDLLHRNVLISPDASRVEAVFSWKCSTRGDFLFDVAWCTFWGGALHPGVAAADAWGRTLTDPQLEASALIDAALRHHCYELHIGATHLGWYAWTGDAAALRQIAAYTASLLERGPLQAEARI